MYCKNCGKEHGEQDKFCPHCGFPCQAEPTMPVYRTVYSPSPTMPRTEIFAIIAAFIFGVLLVLGGIFCLFLFIDYSPWVILGGAGTILGGIGRLVTGACLIGKYKKQN